MGMELMEWKWKSCTAIFAIGDDWATLYAIHSKIEGKGHATKLLSCVKHYYENSGRRFGGTVAIHPAMAHIYQKLGITEYKEIDDRLGNEPAQAGRGCAIGIHNFRDFRNGDLKCRYCPKTTFNHSTI